MTQNVKPVNSTISSNPTVLASTARHLSSTSTGNARLVELQRFLLYTLTKNTAGHCPSPPPDPLHFLPQILPQALEAAPAAVLAASEAALPARPDMSCSLLYAEAAL